MPAPNSKMLNPLKPNTIYKGCCLKLMPLIESNSCDMILCDLPYGTTHCKWDVVLPLDTLWNDYLRVIKPGGAIVLFGREPFTSALVMSNPKLYKHKWVWNKKQSGSAINGKYMPHQLDEDIIVFCKGKVNYYPQMRVGKLRKRGGYSVGNGIMNGLIPAFSTTSNLYYPTNIIELANPRIGKLHPTEKPVPLIETLLKHYTKPGQLVLDNCIGSGTTAVACINLGRNFIGIEKNKHYFDIALNRLKTIK